ncbi:GtrA-like protein [Variovorax sp. PBS-H4]|uniref:GtrA family protein n=1 Tax=Variovorax sp. PBS-H4 TaxID=434008 RepID=UPI00131612FC|nr:GtrA family protein [Variovorax sp. PBS-H4]VTU18912.1 GtrA-like protein [Variovorax sp. PBS-H4]
MKAGREFLLFAVAGAIGFGVDVCVLYLAAPLLGWYMARVLSFVAAATATWALNRRYAFGARPSEASLAREYLGYLLTMVGGAVLNYSVYVLVLHAFSGVWVPALGVALGSCAGLALNFLGARQLVFKSRRGH